MDAIEAELFRNALAGIGDEMVLTIYRTAYSGVLKNIMDYSAAVCDARGRLVAQGLSLPGHLCSIPVALKAALARFGDDIAEGDILVLNDPYEGGMHLPDIFAFRPIFADGAVSDYRATLRGNAARMRRFNEAATWIAQVCWSERISNTNTAHHRVYQETRARFGLGSQLAECARMKAMDAIKAGKQRMKETCPTFAPRGAVRYDVRTFRLMSLDRVSLNTVRGRVVCQMRPGPRQRALMTDLSWTIGGADLAWKDGTYFLHVTQSKEAPVAHGVSGVLGVDRGIARIATDSDGEAFSGAQGTGRRAYPVRRRRLRLIPSSAPVPDWR